MLGCLGGRYQLRFSRLVAYFNVEAELVMLEYAGEKVCKTDSVSVQRAN